MMNCQRRWAEKKSASSSKTMREMRCAPATGALDELDVMECAV